MLAAALSSSRYSTDNGTTWQCADTSRTTFIRNVQITGDKVTGDVYIAGMDEDGGMAGSAAATGTTRSIARPTAVTLGPTPTPAPPSSALAAAHSGFFCTHVQQPRLLATHGLG